VIQLNYLLYQILLILHPTLKWLVNPEEVVAADAQSPHQLVLRLHNRNVLQLQPHTLQRRLLKPVLQLLQQPEHLRHPLAQVCSVRWLALLRRYSFSVRPRRSSN